MKTESQLQVDRKELKFDPIVRSSSSSLSNVAIEFPPLPCLTFLASIDVVSLSQPDKSLHFD